MDLIDRERVVMWRTPIINSPRARLTVSPEGVGCPARASVPYNEIDTAALLPGAQLGTPEVLEPDSTSTVPSTTGVSDDLRVSLTNDTDERVYLYLCARTPRTRRDSE